MPSPHSKYIESFKAQWKKANSLDVHLSKIIVGVCSGGKTNVTKGGVVSKTEQVRISLHNTNPQ